MNLALSLSCWTQFDDCPGLVCLLAFLSDIEFLLLLDLASNEADRLSSRLMVASVGLELNLHATFDKSTNILLIIRRKQIKLVAGNRRNSTSDVALSREARIALLCSCCCCCMLSWVNIVRHKRCKQTRC